MNLAPNGKPSNLNEQQSHLVRTPEFKRWFGDWEKLAYAKLKDAAMDDVTLERLSKNVSKVVDENDEPLVIFHGTKSNFTVFEKSTRGVYGKGFYFTQDLKEAKGYGKKLMSVFVNVKKYATAKQVKDIMLNIEDYRYLEDVVLSKIITENLIKSNFDGVMFEYPNKDKFVVALNSNQIKLANGKNTTFDDNNPDIRFKNGGEIPTHKFILYDDLNEALEDNLYKQATDYFEKKVTDDYWHFSKQYYNGNEITYEVYSVKGGFWLNFEVKNKKIISSSAKLLPIKKYANGGNINFTYEIGGI